MGNLNAYFTDDGSVGLYSDEYNDIYHSKFGALSEAYEKFIFPANIKKFLSSHSEIKILDIDIDDVRNKLGAINATFKGVKNQKLSHKSSKPHF